MDCRLVARDTTIIILLVHVAKNTTVIILLVHVATGSITQRMTGNRKSRADEDISDLEQALADPREPLPRVCQFCGVRDSTVRMCKRCGMLGCRTNSCRIGYCGLPAFRHGAVKATCGKIALTIMIETS